MGGKNPLFSKTKITLHEEWHLYVFENLLTSGLTEDIWIIISISAFNLLHDAVLVKYEENWTPTNMQLK